MTDQERLGALLVEAASILESNGEAHWSVRIREASRGATLEDIASWFGGMGSFNDLLVADHEANRRLDEVRNNIYEIVSRLLRISN